MGRPAWTSGTSERLERAVSGFKAETGRSARAERSRGIQSWSGAIPADGTLSNARNQKAETLAVHTESSTDPVLELLPEKHAGSAWKMDNRYLWGNPGGVVVVKQKESVS